MRRALLLITILLSTSAFADEQTRNLGGFKSIRSKGAYSLLVQAGKAQSITIKGNESFINSVKTDVFGDELVISSKEKHSIRISDDAQVVVTVPELERFKMEGAGKTSLENINAPRFELSYEGAGMLTVEGKTKFFTLKAKGVGLVDTKQMLAEDVRVNVEGVGAVSVNASDKLNASVQGIGTLTYYGHPRSINKSVEGIGSVRAGD
ncbi:MAG: DUF2807 domain-containing protein [Burkholderiales bacterium]|nr:DUF2807 domain-containing protein [Burkholderiales bacterium]